MNQNKRYTKPYTEQGITLVALVVTIVVLLILSGITIASLTGENGLIGKSGEAKKQAEISEGLEQLEIAVTQSTNKRGNIDTTRLAKNLSKINGLKYINNEKQEIEVTENTEIKLTAKVKLKGNTFKINDEGKVSYKKEGAIDNEDVMNSPETYYGHYVTNYNSLSDAGIKYENGQLGKWQIFLADDTNIYLIASNAIHKDYAPLDYNNNGDYNMYFTNILSLYNTATPGNPSVASLLGKLNKQDKYYEWLSKATLGNKSNQQAVLSMLDTDRWNEYEDSEKNKKGFLNSIYASYVIGGPTLEMFFESYNKTHGGFDLIPRPKNDSNVYYQGGYKVRKESTEIITDEAMSVSGLLDVSQTELSPDINSNMYFKNYTFWLASPLYGGGEVFRVRRGIVDSGSLGNSSICFRPLVCLNSDVHLIKNADGETYSLELD